MSVNLPAPCSFAKASAGRSAGPAGKVVEGGPLRKETAMPTTDLSVFREQIDISPTPEERFREIAATLAAWSVSWQASR